MAEGEGTTVVLVGGEANTERRGPVINVQCTLKQILSL